LTRRAEYWTALEDDRVVCELCPHRCRIAPGDAGMCRIRVNRDGELIAAAHGQAIGLSLDPIEKKPLYHFHPGKAILSLGPNGCNLRCDYCQNWRSSQTAVPTRNLEPAELAETADRPGNLGAAFTYTEPLIWFEYIKDCAGPLHQRDLQVVCVSNAFIEPEPLDELLGFVDAFNFDLKSMREGFYRLICKGELDPVLRTIETAIASPTHVEVTYLVINSENDGDDELKRLAAWLAERDPRTPLHLSRYFPAWRREDPPTPAERLERAWEIARTAGLEYVYLGNLNADSRYTDTRCPECGAVLVRRGGLRTTTAALEGDRCSACGTAADFVTGSR